MVHSREMTHKVILKVGHGQPFSLNMDYTKEQAEEMAEIFSGIIPWTNYNGEPPLIVVKAWVKEEE